jgi:hypothetical protein
MKRAIKINFKDGSSKDLILSRAASINTNKKMINIDELPDGTWRLIYDENLIPDFSQVVNLEVIRED